MFTSQLRVIRAGGVNLLLLFPSILAGLFVSATYVGAAAVNALLFTELLGDRRIQKVTVLIVLVAVLLLLRPLGEVLSQLLQNKAGLIIKTNLRSRLLSELDARGPMRAGLGRSGKIQSVLSDGVEAIEPYFVKYFTQLVVTVVTASVLAVFIGQINWVIAIVLLLCGISVIAIPRLWDKALAERGQTHWTAYEDLNADFIDSMIGMPTLKSFGAADQHGEQLGAQSKQLLTSTLSQLRLSLGETGLSSLMKVLGPALGLLIAVTEIKAGRIELSELFLITLLSIEMFRPVSALSSCWHESFFGISALPAMNEILLDPDQESEFKEKTPILAKTANPLGTVNAVDFVNVTYTYIGANEAALTGASFNFPGSRTTALVGLSGSGKSTVLGLLMGFDHPNSGRITISGHSPTEIDITKVVALVPQDPIIFPGTVREILLEANPDASEKQLLEALHSAQATDLRPNNGPEMPEHSDNRDHPDEPLKPEESLLDLEIFEHATNLSGGQKQRLAIARALIRDTPILILDESTSALDTKTERVMLEGIRAARPNLTLILVTHRIDTASRADHIVTMKDGTVTSAGAPDELAQDPNSAWSQLVKAQFGEG